MKWREARLDSLCEDVNVGHVGPSSMHREANGIPFLMGKNIGTGVISSHNIERVTEEFHRSQPKSKLRPGDIVVVRIGKSGQAAKIPKSLGEANCSGLVIIKQPHGIHPDFLVYYLNSPIGRGYSLSQARGSTRLTLNTSSVAETLVPVPPFPEQQRIVGLLDGAFAGIATAKANAEKNLQNARALFESHLQSVFTQRGKGWAVKPLSELCERVTKGSSPRWQGISYVQEPGVLFVTSENVGQFRLLMDSPKYVEARFNQIEKKSILRKGDVLTNLVGGSIGRTAIYDLQDGANINQAVGIIRCLPELLSNEYLTFLLNSPVFTQMMHDNEVNNARANISLTFVSSIPVLCPPISEQVKIVSELNAFRTETQRLASLYQRNLAALDALKKSLLHQAFTGAL